MFRDNVACVYDLFADVINRRTNQRLCSVVGEMIGENDNVMQTADRNGFFAEDACPCRKKIRQTRQYPL